MVRLMVCYGYQIIVTKYFVTIPISIGIDRQLKNKFNQYQVKAGDDVIVMVVNEGERDLYLNFAVRIVLHPTTALTLTPNPFFNLSHYINKSSILV